MKRSIFILFVLVAAVTPLKADKLVVKSARGRGRSSRDGTVVAFNIKKLQITFKMSSKKNYDVSQVIQIALKKNAAFSRAEKLLTGKKIDFSSVISAYDSALEVPGPAWQSDLIEFRRYLAYDEAGMIDKAIDYWCKLLKANPTNQLIIDSVPDNMKASNRGAKLDAVRAIKKVAKRLERDKTKNKKALVAAYNYGIHIANSIKSKKDVSTLTAKLKALDGEVVVIKDKTKPDKVKTMVKPKQVNISGFEKKALKDPVRFISGFNAAVASYKRAGKYGDALIALGGAHEALYKKGGKKDQSHLRRAALRYMLAFFEPSVKGTDPAMAGLYRAAVINAELGNKAAEKKALDLIIESDMKKWVEKAKARL